MSMQSQVEWALMEALFPCQESQARRPFKSQSVFWAELQPPNPYIKSPHPGPQNETVFGKLCL